MQHKIQNLIESGELKIASNIEITTVEEGKVEMKSLKYPPKMESSEEVVAMVTNLDEMPGGPIIIHGLAKETRKDNLVEISASKLIILTVRP